MVTTYRIEPGYNSAQDLDEVWTALKQVVDRIQRQHGLIELEVYRLEPKANRALIQECAASYKPPVEDLTVKVLEDEQAVIQMASEGGAYRYAKESCRRAFCRLVLQAMHQRKMEISIIVG